MPIYEYACTSCDHRLEVIQRMSDAPLRDCPACNTPSLKKLISAAGFRLKGSGWYATDFKDKPKPKPKAKPAADEPAASSSASTPAAASSPAATS